MLIAKLLAGLTRSSKQNSFVADIEKVRSVYLNQIQGLDTLEANHGTDALRAGVQSYLDSPTDQSAAELLNLTSSSANLIAVIQDAKHHAKCRLDNSLIDLYEDAEDVIEEIEAGILKKSEQAVVKARKAAELDGISFDASSIESAYQEQIASLPKQGRFPDRPAQFVASVAQVLGIDPQGASVAFKKIAA